MNKTTLLLPLSIVLLTGCGYGRFIHANAPNTCSGTGWAIAGVRYGDARVQVVPITNLRAGAEFRIFLIPKVEDTDPDNVKNWIVTIEGKESGPGQRDEWITQTSGTYNGTAEQRHTMKICVPEDADDDYYYYVTVQDVNDDDVARLDPRVHVQ